MRTLNIVRATALALALAVPTSAKAQVAVFDAASFGQLLRQVATDGQMLGQLQEQLSAQLNMLKSLPSTVMPGLGNLVTSTQDIMSQVSSIQYTADTLRSQVNSLYPGIYSNESAQSILGTLASMTSNTRDAYTQSMALQNRINNDQPALQQAVQRAEAQGMAAPGPTAATQSVAQILGAMSAQLTQLQDTLTAGFRAQEQHALQQQSESSANQALAQQAWNDPENAAQAPSVNPFPESNP